MSSPPVSGAPYPPSKRRARRYRCRVLNQYLIAGISALSGFRRPLSGLMKVRWLLTAAALVYAWRINEALRWSLLIVTGAGRFVFFRRRALHPFAVSLIKIYRPDGDRERRLIRPRRGMGSAFATTQSDRLQWNKLVLHRAREEVLKNVRKEMRSKRFPCETIRFSKGIDDLSKPSNCRRRY